MKKKAFTLIELIIVIAILALLIAIAIPRYQNSNLSAQATTHNANVRVIKNAAILYSIDHPDDTDISEDEIESYLEGKKFPKPAKALGKGKKFTVKVKNGEVKVSPGPVKVEKNKLVEDTAQP
ncbi:MAG: prepilin-type N-terminal cleavage/methylation domain-containing protein [Peptoniphilus sp.]|nr:prepilin-type N-terminal cleavage/methylation domain-containing protein [Peptoniphilus sp.]MDY6044300.1 prepilin-type N-terminal cleavage/methylation domain-containing protein [Peptoniphilus sp.]